MPLNPPPKPIEAFIVGATAHQSEPRFEQNAAELEQALAACNASRTGFLVVSLAEPPLF